MSGIATTNLAVGGLFEISFIDSDFKHYVHFYLEITVFNTFWYGIVACNRVNVSLSQPLHPLITCFCAIWPWWVGSATVHCALHTVPSISDFGETGSYSLQKCWGRLVDVGLVSNIVWFAKLYVFWWCSGSVSKVVHSPFHQRFSWWHGTAIHVYLKTKVVKA